jgi:hypothetical protein
VGAQWCSLHQRDPTTGDRTPEEQEAFTAALGDVELWFAHQLTTVVLLTTSAPPTRPDYYHSGWTSYESTVARILKKRRSDLWDPVIDVGDAATTRHRQPPMHCEHFRELMAQVTFTVPADAAVVLRLYARTLRNTLGGASALHYEACDWEAAEMALLARVLPECNHLRTLRLGDNRLGQEALDTFARAVGMHRALPELRVLDLQARRPLACTRLPSPADCVGSCRSRSSQGNSLAGLTNPLQCLAEAVSPVTLADVEVGIRPAGLPLLQDLNLQNCHIGAIAFVNFCRALKRGAMPTVLRLALDDNDLEHAGVEPLTGALTIGAMARLQVVSGIPKSGSFARREFLFSLRQLRKLSSRIETDADNAVRQHVTHSLHPSGPRPHPESHSDRLSCVRGAAQTRFGDVARGREHERPTHREAAPRRASHARARSPAPAEHAAWNVAPTAAFRAVSSCSAGGPQFVCRQFLDRAGSRPAAYIPLTSPYCTPCVVKTVLRTIRYI